MRRKLIEADLIECVIGLGPNLFYNSPMEACVLVCRTQKPKARRGKILLINAVNEVTRERAQSFLTEKHIQHIVRAYLEYQDEPGFSTITSLTDVRTQDGNLSIPLYVAAHSGPPTDAPQGSGDVAQAVSNWLQNSKTARASMKALLNGN